MFVVVVEFVKKTKNNFEGAISERKRMAAWGQSDQIPRQLFNIWPFTTMKICPIAQKFRQSRFKNLPITN